ncbi:hypothetical protein GCM10020331_004620 [Ectobacillus funiculus]
MNIYELEGVRNVAGKLTGGTVKVDWCVPEDTLAMADEVKLLDVTPEVILKKGSKTEVSSRNMKKNRGRDYLFHRSNLAVLRELALRFF